MEEPKKIFISYSHQDRDAVAWIAEHAQPGDAVLLAGKGHEYYINIKGEHVPFCEREIIQRVCGK